MLSTFKQLRHVAALADSGAHQEAAEKLRELPQWLRALYTAVLAAYVAGDWLNPSR